MTDLNFRLGVDIGGTFTDFVLMDEHSGRVTVWKSLTTGADPAQGVKNGLDDLRESKHFSAGEIRHVIHATTLITNAIIERKGSKVGLITTAGFRDVLEIGREVRYDLYDLFLQMPEPLVPRIDRVEVHERVSAAGDVLEPLDVESLRSALVYLKERGVESVAIGFLHSYVNDVHEREAAHVAASEFPDLSISVSSEVAREIREYERFSTTVANAFVKPLTRRYFHGLKATLEKLGCHAPLHVMQSNGGVATINAASELPVRLVESGPAAGALIAGYYGELTDEPNVLAFDMGGTTAKLCMIEEGQPSTTYSIEVARVHRFKRGSGLPIRAPSVELIEIGAGGGSIAHIDPLGLLAVGPESTSSHPGPACYGFGGDQPTVTDADLLLGYLNPSYFLGGTMQLYPESAREAVQRQLTKPLGLDVAQLAWGIHAMVNENMATAAGVYIAEKGRDPRRYTLVATGGAGPVHAAEVARKIGLKKVIIPPAAGVASAMGLLVAPPRMDFAHSHLTSLASLDWEQANDIFAGLQAEGMAVLEAVGVTPDSAVVKRTADMRYAEQGHEVSVPLPSGPLSSSSVAGIIASFEDVYEKLYGRLVPGVPLEIVTWRLSIQGPTPNVEFRTAEREQLATMQSDGRNATKGTRPVYFPERGDFAPVTVYDRYELPVGTRSTGPAVIEEEESTIVVGVRDEFAVDQHGNLVIYVGATANSSRQ
jgi:N-methylhydantoinase A